MADDDDYDFSGVSQPGSFDIESSLLSQWRAQNDEEEDDDYSYFWPEQLPYDIEEKLREINKVHQEDETPVESDRPRKISFNTRVQMRAISMRRIPQQAEKNDDEPFDLSKYDTDESVDDVETSISAPREAAKAAPEDVPQSSVRPLPLPTASTSGSPFSPAASPGPAGQSRQRFTNKTAVSRIGQGAAKSPGSISTSGAAAGTTKRGFRDSQNFQLPDGLASDQLCALSLSDEEQDDDDDDADCVVAPLSSDTGYSSGSSTAAGAAPPSQSQPPPNARTPLTAGSETTPANVRTSSSTASVTTQTPEAKNMLASHSDSSQATVTVPKEVSVSEPTSKLVPVPASVPKLASAFKSVPEPLSSSKFVSTSSSVSKSGPSSVSVSKPASVSAKGELLESALASKSASEPELVSVPKSMPSPDSVPVSVPVSSPEQTPEQVPVPPASPPAELAAAPGRPPLSPSDAVYDREVDPGTGSTDGLLPGTVSKSWPELASPSDSERYRPSWSETPHRATGRTGTAGRATGQVSSQQTESGRKLSDAKEAGEREASETTKSCACQDESSRLCDCKGESAIPGCGDGGMRQKLINTKSEDSAVESMDDHTSSNTAESSTDGSIGTGPEPTRPAPDQSYAAIHLSRPDRAAQGRRHELTVTRSASAGTSRPRLCRSLSAGRSPERARPVSSGGTGLGSHPARPRPTCSPVRQQQTGSAPDRPAVTSRPRSAPVRSAVSAPTLPRRQPPGQRAGQQVAGQSAAGASPPPRRRRARSQDPALTFQQWLQQHEKERAQAVQDRKNNAKKRKQEANIKQEKAPQAFRVWLRKKRQQQLMEQRVQQLRQHELLSAAAAPGSRGQPDAFRQWLARKQRERAAAGRAPAQATLRSLSALYRVGRPRPASAAHHPPPAAGDRHHAHLHHIYGPHVSGGQRCRSAHLPGG